MLPFRRYQILKALVQEYIATGQPVGSKHLVDRYDLTCSSATVRSELAALEESGHVYQPHVSSGRIPTDFGYREFVDCILEEDFPASCNIRYSELYDHCLPLMTEVDNFLMRTSALLSNLTHYVAIVLAPVINFAQVCKIDLVQMGPRRVLVVLITHPGQVVSRHLELAEDVAGDLLSEVKRFLNEALVDKRAYEVRALCEELKLRLPPRSLAVQVLDELAACLDEADRDRIHHMGVGELAALPDFAESAQLRPLLNLLEDGLAMFDTLSEVVEARRMVVRIGSENIREELCGMSLVMMNYASSCSDGVVGVIGPTRMDYQRSIAAVRFAAEGLSEVYR